jgi:putative sigma-54 modulation protein
MELQIRSNGTKVTNGMREFIDRRMSKLDRLAEHVVDAHLELRTDTTRTGIELTTAQLTLHTGRHILRAEERDTEPARAIDAAIDKLIVQVRKFNGKKTTKRRRTVQPGAGEVGVLGSLQDLEVTGATAENGEGDSAEPEGAVVRTKRFPVKPMPVDEAIDQMELLGHDFFLFHNADENQFNVLYRRRDGSLGLLQPSI